MIRIYMPDGKCRKLKGTVRVVKRGQQLQCLVEPQTGGLLVVDPIAVVMRGSVCAYTPLYCALRLKEADREFLQQYPDWGIVRDGMPIVRQVVQPTEPERVVVPELIQEIMGRDSDGK